MIEDELHGKGINKYIATQSVLDFSLARFLYREDATDTLIRHGESMDDYGVAANMNADLWTCAAEFVAEAGHQKQAQAETSKFQNRHIP